VLVRLGTGSECSHFEYGPTGKTHELDWFVKSNVRRVNKRKRDSSAADTNNTLSDRASTTPAKRPRLDKARHLDAPVDTSPQVPPHVRASSQLVPAPPLPMLPVARQLFSAEDARPEPPPPLFAQVASQQQRQQVDTNLLQDFLCPTDSAQDSITDTNISSQWSQD